MTMYCGRLNGAWTHIRFWRRDGICRPSNLPVLPSFRDLQRYVPPAAANFDSSLAQMPWIRFRPGQRSCATEFHAVIALITLRGRVPKPGKPSSPLSQSHAISTVFH